MLKFKYNSPILQVMNNYAPYAQQLELEGFDSAHEYAANILQPTAWGGCNLFHFTFIHLMFNTIL